MGHLVRRFRPLLILVLLCAASPIVSFYVLAAVAPQTGGSSQGTDERDQDESGGLQALTNNSAMPLVITVFIFNFAALVLLYGYHTFIQNKYYKTVREGLGRVTEIRTTSTAAFGVGILAGGAAAQQTIEGPSVIVVGSPSTEFKIKSSDSAAAVDQTTWAVEPSANAIVTPSTGGVVKVTAAVAGALVLKATVPGSPPQEFPIAAVQARGSAVDLPWVGNGHGSIAIALVLLGVVVIFGLTEALDMQAIATILGALAGYIFGFRPPQNTN